MSSQAPQSLTPDSPLIKDLLAAFDQVFGLHPGFRPVHAKGLMCTGTFTPAAAAQRADAPHRAWRRESVNVVVRLSDFAGVPNVPDNDPQVSGPRGIAVRFYLAEHSHTDIIGHAHNGFPTRSGEEFLEFFQPLRPVAPACPSQRRSIGS